MTRSWGRLVAGSLLVAVGGLWLLDTADLVELTFRGVLAIALTVIGVSLVIGSRRGSYPALIATGAVLALMLVVSSEDHRPIRRAIQIGDEDRNATVYRPQEADDIRPYRRSAGDVNIDLRRLQLTDSTSRVNARVGSGEINVIVPRDVPVKVEARTGAGTIEIFGRRRASGLNARTDFETPDYDDAEPRVSIEARAGVGSITIKRSGR